MEVVRGVRRPVRLDWQTGFAGLGSATHAASPDLAAAARSGSSVVRRRACLHPLVAGAAGALLPASLCRRCFCRGTSAPLMPQRFPARRGHGRDFYPEPPSPDSLVDEAWILVPSGLGWALPWRPRNLRLVSGWSAPEAQRGSPVRRRGWGGLLCSWDDLSVVACAEVWSNCALVAVVSNLHDRRLLANACSLTETILSPLFYRKDSSRP